MAGVVVKMGEGPGVSADVSAEASAGAFAEGADETRTGSSDCGRELGSEGAARELWVDMMIGGRKGEIAFARLLALHCRVRSQQHRARAWRRRRSTEWEGGGDGGRGDGEEDGGREAGSGVPEVRALDPPWGTGEGPRPAPFPLSGRKPHGMRDHRPPSTCAGARGHVPPQTSPGSHASPHSQGLLTPQPGARPPGSIRHRQGRTACSPASLP